MKPSPFASRLLRQLWAIALLGAFLSGCAIEGGVPNNAATASPAPIGQLPTAPNTTATATPIKSWTIGLIDQPRSLLPYQPSSSSARMAAPISELLFPSPILSYSYGYTGTGVLDRIPSLENGDAVVRKADIYLDDAGSITTTATQVITQVDQLIVTFHWNPGLRWSDGQPVTADDSVFAYEAAKAAPLSPETADRLAQIVAYERVDEHTTRATLQPDLTIPTYFLTYWTPLPRHLLKSIPPAEIFDGEFARQPIGYGPFAIERRGEREIRLTRNQHYFGEPPEADRVLIAFQPNAELMRASLLNGNLDVASSDRTTPELIEALEQDQRDSAMQVNFLASPNWEHLDFNLDVFQLQDLRVRRAIALGFNRKAAAETLFGGQVPVLDSWVLPGQAEAAPADQLTRYEYNPDEARRLLDEAGYPVADANGIRASTEAVTLTFTLLTTEGTPIRQQIAQQFEQDMRAIGIEVQTRALPFDELFAADGPLFLRQFDLVLFGWTASADPGGLLLWSCAAIPSPDNNFSGDNFAGWCVRDANRAIREAVTTIEPVARAAAYLRQQQLWAEQLPVLPLFQRLSVALAAPGVRGLQPDPIAPITWNVCEWRKE